jgi:hypothetical protein
MSRNISTTEFKRLLFDIHDRRPDVRIRIRLLGKMWGESFCSVESVRQDEANLIDCYKNLRLQINNFNEVIQFELECSFFRYQAFYHYQVLNANSLDQTTKLQLSQRTGSFPNSQ